MTFTRALSTNNYGPAKFIVDGNTIANGTHSTIAAALTSSVSGDTIFIRPGTYTENLTLKAGVNLTAYGSDSSLNGTGKVIISGTCTMTAAGSVTISGIQLQTNSAALLAVTGTEISIVNLENCYLNCTNNTGITFSTSSASGLINIYNCRGNIGTTGISLFAHSSAGRLNISFTDINNSGASLTASTVSAGILVTEHSEVDIFVTTSNASQLFYYYVITSLPTLNTTIITTSGTSGASINSCEFSSGTASAISVGAGTTLGVVLTNINSSNTNAITGAGTLTYSGLVFTGTSSKINTTTQTGGTLLGGQTQAPSLGFLGQQLTGTGTAVATTNTTGKTIASVSLTAGIWDVTGMGVSVPTGGTAVMSAAVYGISTTDNALAGTIGLDYLQLNITACPEMSYSVAPTRATLTATTTYYFVVTNFYSSTTCPTSARITATRVG